MNEALKDLYDNFYSPMERKSLRDETEYCISELAKSLEPWQQNLLQRLVILKDEANDRCSLDSFICGFKLAWRITNELESYKNGRLKLVEIDESGVRSNLK